MPIPGSCSIIYREGSGIVKLRGVSNNQCRARFRASFGANIAVPTTQTAGPITLAIALDGQPVNSTQMTVTPAAVGEFFNVGSDVYIDVPTNCCSTLGVRNISGIPVLVQNANLIVERVA